MQLTNSNAKEWTHTNQFDHFNNDAQKLINTLNSPKNSQNTVQIIWFYEPNVFLCIHDSIVHSTSNNIVHKTRQFYTNLFFFFDDCNKQLSACVWDWYGTQADWLTELNGQTMEVNWMWRGEKHERKMKMFWKIDRKIVKKIHLKIIKEIKKNVFSKRIEFVVPKKYLKKNFMKNDKKTAQTHPNAGIKLFFFFLSSLVFVSGFIKTVIIFHQ